MSWGFFVWSFHEQFYFVVSQGLVGPSCGVNNPPYAARCLQRSACVMDLLDVGGRFLVKVTEN